MKIEVKIEVKTEVKTEVKIEVKIETTPMFSCTARELDLIIYLQNS